jgi:superfamily II DNA/RNA helicase
MSTQSFADLGVSRAVVSSLASQGITSPFAIQREVIGDVLRGRDVLAKSPTGSGKTLAFGIPLADRISSEGPRPSALVLAPTRELAIQIVGDIRGIAHARALRVTAVYGGAGLVKQAKEAARSHILVATPGRLEDLLAREAFTLDRIEILVLDEADRMLDMGFRPAVDRIVALCPTRRQTLFFSATLDGEAGRVAKQYTNDAVLHEQGPVARRASSDVEHRFVEVANDDRVATLVRELRRDHERTLVFVRTKRGADRLVKRLGAHGIRALAMHGNKSQRQREQALARFQSGAVDTLVATDVAARGIDVREISHVVNFNPPGDSETYVHRIGRTGRAGATGVGITLVGAGEHGDVLRLAKALGLEGAVGTVRTHGGGTNTHRGGTNGHRGASSTHRRATSADRGGTNAPREGSSASRPRRRGVRSHGRPDRRRPTSGV